MLHWLPKEWLIAALARQLWPESTGYEHLQHFEVGKCRLEIRPTYAQGRRYL